MSIEEISGLLNNTTLMAPLNVVNGVQGVSFSDMLAKAIDGMTPDQQMDFVRKLETVSDRSPADYETGSVNEPALSEEELAGETAQSPLVNNPEATVKATETAGNTEKEQSLAAAGVAGGDSLTANAAAQLLIKSYLESSMLQTALSPNADMTAGLFGQIAAGSSADGSTGPNLTGMSALLSGGSLESADLISGLMAGTGTATDGRAAQMLSRMTELSSLTQALGGSDEGGNAAAALLDTFQDLSAYGSLSGLGTGVSGMLGLSELIS